MLSSPSKDSSVSESSWAQQQTSESSAVGETEVSLTDASDETETLITIDSGQPDLFQGIEDSGDDGVDANIGDRGINSSDSSTDTFPADPSDSGVNTAHPDAAEEDTSTSTWVDPCPGDTDVDDDGICDAIDLEYKSTVSDAVTPVLSADGRTLFAGRADGNGVIAYNISTSALAANPEYVTELAIPSKAYINFIGLLADGRLLVTSGRDATYVTEHLQIYSFDGANFNREENIYTTSNRIYDAVYDPTTDRLYWSDFDTTESVHYYELASTPLEYEGLGTSLGTFTEHGTFALFVDGNYVYRFRALIQVVNPNSGEVVHSLPTDGSETSPCHGNVDKFDDYLIFIDRWYSPINFTVIDISTPEEASQIATLELSNSKNVVNSSFALRSHAKVAIAADSASGLHIIDLSQLPNRISRIQFLGSNELGGYSSNGRIDCTERCCYTDTQSKDIVVLCP